MTSNPSTTASQTDPWKNAGKCSSIYKSMPQNFAGLVRRAYTTEGPIPDPIAWEAKRMLRSMNLRNSFERLLHTFCEDDRLDDLSDNPLKILELLGLKGFSVSLCFMYAYRILKKTIDEKEWGLFLEDRACAFDMGALIGNSLPGTESAHGLLALGGRLIAMLTLMKYKPEEFKQYRRLLHKKGLFCDLIAEMELFGCTHHQVASTIYISMGIPGTVARAAGESMTVEATKELHEKDPEVYRFAIIFPWYNSLVTTGNEPGMTHIGEFYPLASDLRILKEKAEFLCEEAAPGCWMDD